jgi:hypothetical protein
MDIAGFTMSLFVVSLGIILSHILEMRHTLGKRLGS